MKQMEIEMTCLVVCRPQPHHLSWKCLRASLLPAAPAGNRNPEEIDSLKREFDSPPATLKMASIRLHLQEHLLQEHCCWPHRKKAFRWLCSDSSHRSGCASGCY